MNKHNLTITILFCLITICYAGKNDITLIRKKFIDKGVTIKIISHERGIMGEHVCSVKIYEENQPLMKMALSKPITGIKKSDVKLIELGEEVYGIEFTYRYELPQEGDFSSSHTKSVNYNFYARIDGNFKHVLAKSVHFESVPYNNKLELDYKSDKAIVESYKIDYVDEDNDGIKDIVITNKKNGKKETVIIKR